MSPPGHSVMIAARVARASTAACRGDADARDGRRSAGDGHGSAAPRGCFDSTARWGALRGRRRRGRARVAGGAAGRRGGADRLREPGPSGSPCALGSRRLEGALARGARGALPARACAPRAGLRSPCAASRGIDARGLHVTNLAALARSLERVAVPGAVCLVDGFSVPSCSVDHRAVWTATRRAPRSPPRRSIAKVTRDRYMTSVDTAYPQFGFAGNVGYSTPEHRAAIIEHGPSALHRRSFQSIAYSQLELG